MAKFKTPQLEAIARALGLPLEAFYTDVLQGEAGEAAALLLFWSKIGDAQGRKRVLSVARQEAERSGGFLERNPLSGG